MLSLTYAQVATAKYIFNGNRKSENWHVSDEMSLEMVDSKQMLNHQLVCVQSTFALSSDKDENENPLSSDDENARFSD